MGCPNRPDPLELALTRDEDAYDFNAPNALAVAIGTPPQQIRLTPLTSFSALGVHDASVCMTDGNASCPGLLGGTYNGAVSTTRRVSAFDQWNGTWPAGAKHPEYTYFNDIMRFGSDTVMGGVPMMTLATKFKGPGGLPIGSNSTFLLQLVDAGLITSNSWGYYAGTRTSPGSLILGGYSPQFLAQRPIPILRIEGCSICARVHSMALDRPNGTLDIYTARQGYDFAAVFEPYQDFLTLPSNVFDDFLQATNGTLRPDGLAQYTVDNVPTGDITFTLSNSLSTTIPNDMIFTDRPPVVYGTAFTLAKNSVIARIQRTDKNYATFGFPYMSNVYLMYDNDRQQLNISNAVPNGTSQGSITAICPIPELATGKKGDNKAAIIGGAVGGVILALLVVALLVLGCRRRRRRALEQQSIRARDGDNTLMVVEKDSKQVSPASLLSAAWSGTGGYWTSSKSAELHARHREEAYDGTSWAPNPPKASPRTAEPAVYELPVDTSTHVHHVTARDNSRRYP